MPSSFKWRVPLILVVIAFSGWHAFPLEKRISLGLDLQGGMHLVLKVDTEKVPPEARGKDVTGVALEVIRNRI
ncbi:MAG: protein translocase subunit SecD, partial [Candidatus Omnitrophica bacterium]|nr:protein translocase subunit SecD [Candidatus Omnitrophota bacterium]